MTCWTFFDFDSGYGVKLDAVWLGVKSQSVPSAGFAEGFHGSVCRAWFAPCGGSPALVQEEDGSPSFVQTRFHHREHRVHRGGQRLNRPMPPANRSTLKPMTFPVNGFFSIASSVLSVLSVVNRPASNAAHQQMPVRACP